MSAFALKNLLLHSAAPRAPGRPERKPDAPAAAFNLRLLVAEDNPVNQRVILHMLKRLGFKPDIVANGLEVLAALHRQPYDVILMDMQMPELDGYEASERVRREFPPEAQPRIIAVTANALAGDREKCLAAGTDDYLAKPVTVEGLSRILLKHAPTAPPW